MVVISFYYLRMLSTLQGSRKMSHSNTYTHTHTSLYIAILQDVRSKDGLVLYNQSNNNDDSHATLIIENDDIE